jgi:predicted nucleotidyltransferase
MGWFLPMKHDTFNKYPRDSLDLTQRALLTTWDCLADYREDLVLVGGLAVRYLTRRATQGLPDAVTIDVDFGISISASNGMYGSIRQTLSAHDFRWAGHRFVRKIGEMTLFLDLLTDDDKADTGSVVVDDGLHVGIVPGINRAFACQRTVEISGKSLLGVEQTERVRIAEVGPMLVLKLNAFAGRKAPKDAHDIAYLALNYLGGIEEVIAGFAEEKAAGNRGMPRALRALKFFFGDVNAQGPMSCAAFQMNNAHLLLEREHESLRIRRQCVTLAQALLS